MDEAERELVAALMEVMRAHGDVPGEISGLDVLDNLASIGARAVPTREVADDFDAGVALARALNNLPGAMLDETDPDTAVTHVDYVLRREGLTLVRDVFGDASPEYFRQFE